MENALSSLPQKTAILKLNSIQAGDKMSVKMIISILLMALLIAMTAYQNGGIAGAPGINGTNGLNGTNGTNGKNQSDNTKVNKSGDTITGSLIFTNNSNISFDFGLRIGNVTNYSSQSFQFNGNQNAFGASFAAYNDTACMYSGNAVNAYYEGIAVYPTIPS